MKEGERKSALQAQAQESRSNTRKELDAWFSIAKIRLLNSGAKATLVRVSSTNGRSSSVEVCILKPKRLKQGGRGVRICDK